MSAVKQRFCWLCDHRGLSPNETDRASHLCISCEIYIRKEAQKVGNLRYRILQRNVKMLQQSASQMKKKKQRLLSYNKKLIRDIDYILIITNAFI